PGGRFGYRMQYPAMRVGPYELYWHRPLVAFRSPRSGHVTTIYDAPLGYLTAYPADRPEPDKPVAVLWPRMLERPDHVENVALFRRAWGEGARTALLNVRKLLEAHELRGGPLPRSFARRLLTLPTDHTLDDWLTELPSLVGDSVRGAALADALRHR